MDQNNNYKFDTTTGQPINQQSQQQPIQNQATTNMYSQPMQSTSTVNTYQQPTEPQQPKKNFNVKLLIIIAIAIIVVVVGIVLIYNQNNTNNNTNNDENSSTENNNLNTSGTVDKNTNTNYDENGAFLLRIESVSTVSERGTVVTGTIDRGTIKINDEVQVIGLDKEIITTTVAAVEAFKSNSNYAKIGDNVGLLLKGVEEGKVQVGQVVAKPNSIAAIKKFDADLLVVSTEDGGRSTPFFDGFSPEFYFKTDITGTINLPKGKEMVNPGENVSATVTLAESIALDVGTEFSIREGGRIIANGKITKVY